MAQRVSPKSQLEKRMDALSQNEGGVGVFVNEAKNAERFNDYSEDALAAEAGEYSHAEGHKTVASSLCAHAEGYNTEASEAYTHAEGHSSRATKWFSHAEGWATLASGDCAHAEGRNTVASGKYAHAEGYETKALDDTAHAEGLYTTAGGGGLNLAGAHAEGCNTVANADGAHAEGGFTIASNTDAHAEGYATQALGRVSHAGGCHTIASADYQTAIGKWNEEDENALFIVGCGENSGSRKNAFVVDKEGNVYIKGSITAGGDAGSKYREGNGILLTEAETAAEYYINVKPATSTEIGGVIVGDGLKIDDSGKLSVKHEGGDEGSVYEAGTGISITEGEESSVISVAIDNDTITVDEGGNLKAAGVTIENAAIIQEADAKYLLHNYTLVDYVQGNKIMYGGAQNQIIAQGLVVYRAQSAAPNGATLPGANKNYTYNDVNSVPNVMWYADVVFPTVAYDIDWGALSRIYYRHNESGTGSGGAWSNYSQIHVQADGTEVTTGTLQITNYNGYAYGFTFVWDKIYPPGSAYKGNVFEFGYAECVCLRRSMNSSGIVSVTSGGVSYALPFVSEAEYNAAVALTYEPRILTQVNETITEV